jgi:hypothetical protein
MIFVGVIRKATVSFNVLCDSLLWFVGKKTCPSDEFIESRRYNLVFRDQTCSLGFNPYRLLQLLQCFVSMDYNYSSSNNQL